LSKRPGTGGDSSPECRWHIGYEKGQLDVTARRTDPFGWGQAV